MKEGSETEKNNLYEKLTEYCRSDFYPFHMPGHKRRLGTLEDPFTFDITEIEDFDNLHHAEGILLEAAQRAARFYGSSETFFLINGSTCGILSAIGAVAPQGRILMARNSHKAAYHAICLNHLEAVYLYPEQGQGACAGPVAPDTVEEALKKETDIRAVFLTSPTYEGVVSDVKEIARIAHAHGIPLIVDEAHGAHFGMHPIFPESALRQGADVVIQSLHKTLPSLTQTALLHVNGSLVDRKKLRRMLGVYQSSSPSYVLMSSIDQCIRLLEKQGERLFAAFAENLAYFCEETKELKVLELIRTDDPSKIIISSGSSGLSGREISTILRDRYHLEMEMEAVCYALALTSVGDTREGFERLVLALKELDRELEKTERIRLPERIFRKQDNGKKAQMTIWEAQNAPVERILLAESGGHISGEFIYLYPPGIPLVVPGERIEEAMLRQLLEDKRMGYSLQGMEDYSMEYLWVVKE